MTASKTTIANAYGQAEAWAAGPGRVYDALAHEIVRIAPVSFDGARVLDLGAGTGAATRALEEAGARPFALDLSLEMLQLDQASRPPSIAGDALALPFRSAAFDAVVAAFVVSHVLDPVGALVEAARVTRSGGAVVASTFSESGHPAKPAVERCAEAFGYARPAWYDELKSDTERLTSDGAAFRRVALDAGLERIELRERTIDVGLRSAEDFVAYRLGMPNLAPFVGSLDEAVRAELFAAACHAVGARPEPYAPTILVLTGRVAA